MKRLLCLFIGLCITLPATAAEKKSVMDIKTWQTSHGTKVMYVYLPELPMVDINVVFAAGSAYDDNQYGTAFLTNAMLDEGTNDLNADALAEAFEKVGAMFSTSTSRDQASLHLRSMTDAQYLTLALSTFADAITHPAFPEKNFARIKDETITLIKESQQNPSAIASKAFYELVYGSYPYAHPTYGNEKTIGTANLDQIKRFHQKYYVAENALIAIVGNVKRDQAEKMANQLTVDLPSGSKALPLSPPTFNAGPLTKHIQYPATQTYVRIGNMATKINDPINYALNVGNYTLGGKALISRLFLEVREQRGLSYNVGSSFNPQQENGTFVISLQARSDNAKQAMTVSRDVLQNFITNGPTLDEVKKAKQGIIDSFPNQLQSNGRILSAISTIGFYQLPLDYYDTYCDKIAAVTLDQINAAFKKTVNPQQMITVTVGPEKNKTSKAAQQMSETAMVAVKW